MKRAAAKGMLLPCLLLIAIISHAQKQNFSFEQIFKNEESNVTQQLPMIQGWADDSHYILAKKEADGHIATYLVDAKTGQSQPHPDGGLIAPPEITVPGSVNLTYSPDHKWAAYTKKDNNLYVRYVMSGKETALTTDGSATILNGYASWVYYEEILGRASRYKAFWWSDDSKHLCFMRFDETQVPVFPIYVADGQHGYLENQRYPKAGDKNPEVKIGIASVNPGEIVWADFNAQDDQYFGAPAWSPDGQLWVQWMNRKQNNLKFYAIDLANGSKKEVYDEKQSTWIDLDESDRITFLSAGKGCIVKSDRDGWENLYYHDNTGKLINAITTGNFWGTTIVKIDEKAGVVYLKARKENTARYDLYKATLNGKTITRLSFGDFSHDFLSVSPNGSYFITAYSNLNTPAVMALVDASKGKVIREVATSKGSNFNNYNLPKSELVYVPSADGLFQLPVSITYPINFDPAKKYPVLISIYGGPNAGTVYDRWKPAITPAQWWAQEGMIQVAFDNRSSGHFGKKGLNYIFRQLGKYEIEDFMTCGRWLKKQTWVDSNKLCITGGSFGGYMTCMALTYGADVFPYGIANSSVTDWQFYDTHYTERYMNTPQDNPDGYKSTSVLTYADKYKGLLRIVHGTSDDNVHMQNSLVLINKLEDLKKHFEFMAYPGERHGIMGLKGVHNRYEAYKFYYQYLLEKPMPAIFWAPDSQQRGF